MKMKMTWVKFLPVNTSVTPLFLVLVASAIILFSCKADRGEKYMVWDTYRGSPDALQYSALHQIDTSNVHLLQPAWTFHTGDSGNRTTIECNPIIIGDRMYITSPGLDLIALDAASGQEVWRYEPAESATGGGINRGLTYYKTKDKACLFLPVGHYLYAIDAGTGKLVESFGDYGKIDLRIGLGKDTAKLSVSLTTPGIIFKNLIIIGSATGEGYDASPGHIRAYDAGTGEMAWIFHTIPGQGETGHESWAWMEGENYGGANNWGGMSLDEKKGVVYASTGSPTYDFYGANRIGQNLFGNCILALDAASGVLKWHYQAVHHDIWDYDLPCAPTLADISWEGRSREVLLQPTKMGELLVLDRHTGEALLDPEERSVPASGVPGEAAFPSQPFGQGIRLTRQGWDTSYLTNISDSARAFVLKESAQYQGGGLYTPPSLQGTLGMPGTRGGMLWGGISFDPVQRIAYANCNDFAMIFQLQKVVPPGGGEASLLARGYNTYMLNCTSCHGADRKGQNQAVPMLTGLGKKYSKSALTGVITRGKGLMPAYSQFSEPELDALAAFLLDENTGSGDHSTVNPDGPGERSERFVLRSYKILTDKDGYPGVRPPWGTLNAVDMNTGRLKWQVPLGYYPALKEKGLGATGTQNFGGCAVTAGGLVFIGATADERFRAFRASDGKELWSFQLPAGGYATPSVYQVKGKQYVVIAAGGGNRNGTPSSDVYLAFALTE
ncbi:MAG TPA: PQQ-binding-like beta-propeller repeat protein [Saprospiraceae bacterium]|nr:PQQ-binding-like beta-propeller repeat protein [Saprospiraceae bacterium]HNT20524.1 PQQ-binding-like beta-propeller repeat protein [Saprospiraceae bacterium]